jgi:hypothetical protein
MSGLLVGGCWLVLALVSDPPRWQLYAVVVSSLTLLSAEESERRGSEGWE